MALVPVTITIKNSLTEEPISGVAVSIWNSSLSSLLIPSLTTNTEGIVTTSLPQSTSYKILLFKEKTVFTSPQTITVGTSSFSLTIYGSTKYLEETIKDKVLLYGYIKYLDLSPVQNAKVFIRVSPIPQFEKNLLLSKNDLVIITDQNGFFSALLPGDTQVTISIPETHFQLSKKLPRTGEVEISELLLTEE